MTQFVQGVKSLFTGKADGGQEEAMRAQQETVAKQREQQQLQLETQKQGLQQQEAITEGQSARTSRAPRGRRLLLASTGESGLQSKLGG